MLRCVGRQALSVLLDRERGPLHEGADLAIYGRATLTSALILRLVRAGRALPGAFAADKIDGAGHHEPVIASVASQGLEGEVCVGLPMEKLAR